MFTSRCLVALRLTVVLLFSIAITANVAIARMTDEYLFETVLNLDYPGLDKVKAAVRAGDYSAAKQAWAAHVRSRKGIPKYFETADFGPRVSRTPRPHGGFEPYKTARKILDGDHSHWAYGVNPKSRYNCVHLRHMAWKYEETKDELFPKAWVRNMTYFVDTYPPGPYDQMDEGEFQPNVLWGLLNTGNRMSDGYWNAYMAFLHSPQFTDEAIVDYTKLMTEMAMRVRARRGFGNWETMQMEGLYSYTLLFPESRFSEQWRDFAIDIMYRYLDDHIYPDGCNVEISKHYQAVATLQHISAMVAKAAVFGKLDDFPRDFKDRLERVYDFNLKIMPPDRNAFQFGEGRTFPTPNPPFDEQQASGILESDFYMLEHGLELFPQRDDFRWVVTEGRQGTPPAQSSFCLPDSGFVIMRSSWQRDANFLGMKGSNTGLMHGDHGRNNIVLWAYGRPMLWNTPQSGWDSTTKSLVTVDGKSQLNSGGYGTMEPINLAWQSTPEYDHAASVYDAFWGKAPERPCRHIRRVLFVKPDVFLVIDDMIAIDDDMHTYEARWVVKSERLETSGDALVTIDPDQPNVAIVPVASSGLSVASSGLSVATFGPRQHPDFTDLGETYKDVSVGIHARSGRGDQRFVTLLLPMKPGESNPRAHAKETSPQHWTIALADGRCFTISVAADPEGRIEFQESGGASRRVSLVTGPIGRTFYLHYENFEVYDERESRIVYENVTHHVPTPAGLHGAQGRFVGAVPLSKDRSVTARLNKAVVAPETEALTIKGLAGVATPANEPVECRMGLDWQDQIHFGPWLNLAPTGAGQLHTYQVTLPVGQGVHQVTPCVEFSSTGRNGPQTAYLDRLRILCPGETE